MKVGELIKLLQKYSIDTEVFCKDHNGYCYNIKNIMVQDWQDHDIKTISITHNNQIIETTENNDDLDISVGDKVKITKCSKQVEFIYLNKVGTVLHVWPNNPYGQYNVILDDGCNRSFFRNELEIVEINQSEPTTQLEDNTP